MKLYFVRFGLDETTFVPGMNNPIREKDPYQDSQTSRIYLFLINLMSKFLDDRISYFSFKEIEHMFRETLDYGFVFGIV